MRGCVIGAGPSGLYAAKFLAMNGIPCTIYEKTDRIMGNYQYARAKGEHLESILANPDIDIRFNTDIATADTSSYDFYVVASGGVPRLLEIPGGNLAVSAIDIVKQHYAGTLPYLGDRICIIGMGNVAMDLVHYLYGKCKSISIFSRQPCESAPFSNHILRELIDKDLWNISAKPEIPQRSTVASETAASRKTERRNALMRKLSRPFWSRLFSLFNPAKPQLTLNFNSKIDQLTKHGDGCKAEIGSQISAPGGIKSETFDFAISSAGFIPHKLKISTEKPVFYTGWCTDAHGTIADAQLGARNCVDTILTTLHTRAGRHARVS